jgi:NADPH-dependent curcumin reductase CurA
MTTSTQIVLNERPTARIDDLSFRSEQVELPELGNGEILVKTCWLAFAPAMRSALNDIPSYVPPVAIGEVMRATGLGQVVASRNGGYAEGDLVTGPIGWQDHCVASPDADPGQWEIVPAGIGDPKSMLTVLGTSGMTAYFGMKKLGRPTAGDTVLVTAAAGSVGSLAGQIARAMGAGRIIGTAGSEEKRAWVREIGGFDDCIDYKDSHVFRALRGATNGAGYNVIFDNVGGALLDNALGNIANGARVVLCGSISTGYMPKKAEVGLHNYAYLTTRRGTMAGFIVTDFADEFPAAIAEMEGWIAEGKIHWAEDMAEGLENSPQTLQRLFDGENLGKQLLHVADPV